METVTILYYTCEHIALQSETLELPVTSNGRINIPDEHKEDGVIVAVCRGEVDIINRLGDRLKVNNFSLEL